MERRWLRDARPDMCGEFSTDDTVKLNEDAVIMGRHQAPPWMYLQFVRIWFVLVIWNRRVVEKAKGMRG